jgi:lipoprotein-releasing system ATP-binding protein
MSKKESILTIASLWKTYQTSGESIEVLKGVNLSVEAGTTVAVTGESGCGKSTLLNLIGGLDFPTSGNIKVGDREIGGLSEEALSGYRNTYVGFIFQFHFLLKDFTALENVVIPAMVGGASFRSLKGRGEKLLEDVGLSRRRDAFPQELSGGERQRVAVARALMNEPLLILADEPTGNLDERNSRLVRDILFELVEKQGRTMILVTHDKSISAKADMRFVLKHGELVNRK